MTEQKAIQKHSKECIHRIEVIEEFMKTIPNNKECVKNIEVLTAIVKILEEVQQYQALGTVEELREAREKQRAKKILKQKCDGCDKDCVGCDDYVNRCPTCKESLDDDYMTEYAYCPNCGQAIDWSEEE